MRTDVYFLMFNPGVGSFDLLGPPLVWMQWVWVSAQSQSQSHDWFCISVMQHPDGQNTNAAVGNVGNAVKRRRRCRPDAERRVRWTGTMRLSSSLSSWWSSDNGQTLTSVEFAGHHIACFMVGGEPRLCLPQLLALIVDRVDLQQVRHI